MIHPSNFRWSLDVLHDNEEVTFNGSIGYSDIPPKKSSNPARKQTAKSLDFQAT